ncbi:sensor histidine kinase [Burkholderia gladioli]|uniref:sensor histidine kinase n=1 Tax=Burkholderia gladioli TaxID=28095 RepID=UPI00163E4725|nr:HAMP domain-containing sensor histidine kinase [Burkholderia gladioli]
MTYYQAKIGNATLVCYGTLSENWRSLVKAQIAIKYKDDLKGRSLNAILFNSWLRRLKEFWSLMESDRERLISEALHPLHETPKLAEEIRNASEGLINARPGSHFEEKFESATTIEKTLFKASELLVDSFDLLAVFFNPESAKLGDLHVIEPYKLIDKLSRILAINRSGGVRKRVRLVGTSFRKYQVLESFKLIPLVLLGNAIKYSMQGDVVVEFFEAPGHTQISFSSTGPAIDEDEFDYIFQRGARGRSAQAMDKDGMGVGLFVAKKSAEANGTTITVRSVPLGYSRNNIELAENHFTFRAKDVN